MSLYKNLLSRADQGWLMSHLDSGSLRLVRALSGSEQKTSVTRGLFTSQYSPEEVLSNSEIRKSLFELLRQDEADSLATRLSLAGDSYKNLAQLAFRKGSFAHKTLLDFLGVEVTSELDIARVKPTEDVVPRYGLFEYQRKAVEKAKELVKRGNRVVLHMPTGAGKTRSAMHVLSDFLVEYPGCYVLWLANSEELCEQAAGEFVQAWSFRGNREISLCRFWGSYEPSLSLEGDGFLVAGFAKLYSVARTSPTKLAEIGDKVGIIVVDEAHQAIAPTYRLVIDGVAARKNVMPVLGLTATPGRTWNDPDKDKQLAEFFCWNKVTLEIPGYKTPLDYLVSEGYLAQPNFRTLEHYGTQLSAHQADLLAKEMEIPASILLALAQDEVRTLKIISELESLTKAHARIIAFATTVKHAESIALILHSRGYSVKAVTSRSPSEDRSAAIAWYKERSSDPRILINYGVLTTGFDAPQTSAALIARPTKSLVLYSQMVGRAIRGVKAKGNKEAEIVTVVDVSLPGFGNINEAFENWEDVW
jgi:DNA repair protein RadD